jgi:hypothetical protein
MKRYLAIALAASFGILSTAPAFALGVADYTAGVAANGIGNSRHNLGSFGEHIVTGSTSEICVFCHTPHHTNTAVAPSPLWNRGNAGTYTAYGTTIAGTSITTIGSVTAACLSCHDGVTTFDNLVNAPGKGGVTAGGADRGWSFIDAGTPVSDVITSARLKIGEDLSNDHPMSVVYDSTKASLRPQTTVINTIDITAELAGSAVTAFGGNMAQNRWAVKGYISDTATIADLLRGSTGTVECSSCHDPHFNNKSWDEVDTTYNTDLGVAEFESNGLFLRRVGGNTGSGVCRTCHNK